MKIFCLAAIASAAPSSSAQLEYLGDGLVLNPNAEQMQRTQDTLVRQKKQYFDKNYFLGGNRVRSRSSRLESELQGSLERILE